MIHGLNVLRFWNNEVLKENDAVLSVIFSSLSEDVPPHPDPLPRGEGAIDKSVMDD